MQAVEAEPRLRDLGLRGDIIKTMHRALTERGLDRAFDDFVINAPDKSPPIVGRLVEPGLHDEFSGEAYAVIDGVDGRAYNICFKDVDAFDHAPPYGGIVELRRFGEGANKQAAIPANKYVSFRSISAEIIHRTSYGKLFRYGVTVYAGQPTWTPYGHQDILFPPSDLLTI